MAKGGKTCQFAPSVLFLRRKPRKPARVLIALEDRASLFECQNARNLWKSRNAAFLTFEYSKINLIDLNRDTSGIMTYKMYT